jgi:hypothetical protein
MRRILLRILPLGALLLAVSLLMAVRVFTSGSGGAAARQAGEATSVNPVRPAVSPEVAQFVFRPRPERSPAERLLGSRSPAAKPAGPDWSQLLQRHANGDPAALQELLAAVTPENALQAWEALRNAKLSPEERRSAYEALGRVGGGDLVRQLVALSDPDAALAVKGWGQSDPGGALDWFRQIDVFKDPQLQQYLKNNHLNEQGFLDRLSAGLLDSLFSPPDRSSPEAAREAYAADTTRLIESLLEEHPRKAEAMMRELTDRFLALYDGKKLSAWVNQLGDPAIQGAVIQRVIEAGTFKDAPFAAVDLAFSLENPQSRGPAISAAFGKLGSGVGGVDPGAVAAELIAMPPGRDKDFAINGFAHGLVGIAPETALQWAGSISQDGFRDVVVRNVTRRIEGQAARNGK